MLAAKADVPEITNGGQPTLTSFGYARHPPSENRYLWILFTVMGNNSINTVASPVVQQCCVMNPIDWRTLRKDIIRFADVLALRIKSEISSGDGWTCNHTHYFGWIHTWPYFDEKTKKIVIKRAYLALSPFFH